MKNLSTGIDRHRVTYRNKRGSIWGLDASRVFQIVSSRTMACVIIFIFLSYAKYHNLPMYDTVKQILGVNFNIEKIIMNMPLEEYIKDFYKWIKMDYRKEGNILTEDNKDSNLDGKTSTEVFEETKEATVNTNIIGDGWFFEPEEQEKKVISLPIKGRISSNFGMRMHPIKKTNEFHKGVDIAANSGVEIEAVVEGVVKESGFEKSYGNYIKIQSKDNLVTLYAHCSKLLKKKGENVKEREVIALVGDTGTSIGPHLHFEVRMSGKNVDPIKWISDSNK